MHFERHFAFQNAYNYIFSRKPEKILGFTSKFRQGRVTLNTGIFVFGLGNFSCFLSPLFDSNLFQTFFQEHYKSVRQIEAISRPTF